MSRITRNHGITDDAIEITAPAGSSTRTPIATHSAVTATPDTSSAGTSRSRSAATMTM